MIRKSKTNRNHHQISTVSSFDSFLSLFYSLLYLTLSKNVWGGAVCGLNLVILSSSTWAYPNVLGGWVFLRLPNVPKFVTFTSLLTYLNPDSCFIWFIFSFYFSNFGLNSLWSAVSSILSSKSPITSFMSLIRSESNGL